MSENIIAGYDLNNLEPKSVAELATFSRRIAAEGSVLLKNENGILPFKEGEKISTFWKNNNSVRSTVT